MGYSIWLVVADVSSEMMMLMTLFIYLPVLAIYKDFGLIHKILHFDYGADLEKKSVFFIRINHLRT